MDFFWADLISILQLTLQDGCFIFLVYKENEIQKILTTFPRKTDRLTGFQICCTVGPITRSPKARPVIPRHFGDQGVFINLSYPTWTPLLNLVKPFLLCFSNSGYTVCQTPFRVLRMKRSTMCLATHASLFALSPYLFPSVLVRLVSLIFTHVMFFFTLTYLFSISYSEFLF